MARATEWRRITFTDTNFSFFGWQPGPVLEPGETAIRTRWALTAWSVYGDEDNYPPGTTLLRAGIILADAASTELDTPVSQPNSEWMDLATIPWKSQIATSTGVDWLVLGDTGPYDKDCKAMRKVPAGTEPYAVWLCWELALSGDQVAGFNFRTAGAVDVLVALA